MRFTTPVRGPVRVGVFDLSGRLVRPCVDNVLDPGSYSFQVDLGNATPGMYFVRLWTPQDTRHEKFVLMR